MKQKNIFSLIFSFLLCVAVPAQNMRLIDSLENIAKNAPADTSLIPVLFQLNIQYRSFKPDSALAKCQLALAICEKFNFKKGLAKTYLSLSVLARYKGETPVALNYQLKALAYFEEINDKPDIAKVYGNMGITYWQQGDYNQALKFYTKALEIDSQIGNKQGISAG